MKKILLFSIVAFAFLSCSTSIKQDKNKDSLSVQTEAQFKDSDAKAIRNKIIDKVFGDTTGLYKSPIKVLSFKLVKKEYSNYRDVFVSYKNVSDKRITGIKFRWKGINAFGEPADMGNAVIKGLGAGFTDTEINPNKTDTATWDVLSADAKKLIIVFPFEIAFEDGSKWKLSKD